MSLIEKISSNENIYLAIETIKSSPGSKTPGVDGKTIENIIANINKVVLKIKKELSDGKYHAGEIRRVNIPKGKGETRPLGIPNIYDRIVQQCIKQVIEPVIDKKFHPNSFGFRPGRSTEHAIAQNNNLINIAKFYFVVDIDIKSFFDNINHSKLIKQLRAIGIKENKVISIIKNMLKAKTKLPTDEIIENNKGVPQGGVLSPLLANIVLNELDWWIHRQWTGIKLKNKYSNIANKEKSLGIRITTIKNNDKRTVRTFISSKAKMSIKKTIAKEITQLKKNCNKYQAQKYNTIVAGIQNYYCKATMVSKDLGEIGYIMGRKLIKLFGKGSYTKDKSYCRRYRNYNFKVWNVAEVTLYTIGACKYKIVKSYSSKKEMFDKMDE